MAEENKKEEKKEKKQDSAPSEAPVVPRLMSFYRDEVVPKLRERFDYTNPMAVPKLTKIGLNIGTGRALENAQVLVHALRDLSTITGQKPVVTRSKKSVAAFKIRDGYQIGAKVTLRGKKMYEFFDRLVSLAIPRIRDFRGFSRSSFDGRGNYTLGIQEQSIFPDIDPDDVEIPQGMDITFVTSAQSDDEAYELMKGMGFPFKD